MRKEEKNKIIENLTEQLKAAKNFYLTDISNLNSENTFKLRKKCFENNIKLIVVKNTLLKKALERIDREKYQIINDVLKNNTALMICENPNFPAKLIKEFRKSLDRPILKAAYVEESIYIGDSQVDVLIALKSKEELIGEIITLLQSPIRNVISGLQSGGQKLAGILETLSNKSE